MFHNKYGKGKITSVQSRTFKVKFGGREREFPIDSFGNLFSDKVIEPTIDDLIKTRFKRFVIPSVSVGYIGKLFTELRINYCIRLNVDLHDNTSRVFLGMRKNAFSWNLPEFTKAFESIRDVKGVFIRVPDSNETKYAYNEKSLTSVIIKAYSSSSLLGLPNFLFRKEAILDTNNFNGKRTCKRQYMSLAYREEYIDKIKGANCFLIDDFVNTGSSLVAATKLLYDLGAMKVYAFSVARLKK